MLESVRFTDGGRSVVILDQTLLPGREVYLELSKAEEMYEAILHLRVRGAPAIGIFAAYGLCCLSSCYETEDAGFSGFLKRMRRIFVVPGPRR